MMTVEHTNIIRYYDAYYTEDKPDLTDTSSSGEGTKHLTIVMELADTNLGELIKKNRE